MNARLITYGLPLVLFLVVYGALYFLGQPNPSMQSLFSLVGLGGEEVYGPVVTSLMFVLEILSIALVASVGFYFFLSARAKQGSFVPMAVLGVLVLDASAYSFFTIFLAESMTELGFIMDLLYYAFMAALYFGTLYLADANKLLRVEKWTRPALFFIAVSLLYKFSMLLYFVDIYRAQNWVSIMFPLMVVAGFFGFYALLGWAEKFFDTKWVSHPVVPVALFLLAVIAFHIVLWFFFYNTYAQIQAQGGQFAICWNSESCNALQAGWQQTNAPGPYFAANFVQEYGKSSFLLFVLAAMAAWGARWLVRKFGE